MTATPTLLGGFTSISNDDAMPDRYLRPLAAAAQVGKGQFVTVAPATGYAALNDGTVPNQIGAGNGCVDELSSTSSVAGAAYARLQQHWFYGLQASAVSLDGFTDADFGTPFYIASENTLGKLSNNAGSNRSLGGFVFGLAFDGTPVAWAGIVPWLLARSVLVANAYGGGSLSKVIDAGATTDTVNAIAEAIVEGPSGVHGPVASVSFVVEGTTLAASGVTNFSTLILWKRDGIGGAAVQVASVNTTVLAFTQFTSVAWTLSVVAGATDILETDILTVTKTHGGTGAIIPAGKIRVVRKVQ